VPTELDFPELKDADWLTANSEDGPIGISEKLGCSYHSAWRACKAAGINCFRTKRLWSSLEQEIIEDLLHTWGGELLAAALGRTPSVLWRIARRNGVRCNPRRVPRDPAEFWSSAWPNYINFLLEVYTPKELEHLVIWPKADVRGGCEACRFLTSCSQEFVYCERLTIGDVMGKYNSLSELAGVIHELGSRFKDGQNTFPGTKSKS